MLSKGHEVNFQAYLQDLQIDLIPDFHMQGFRLSTVLYLALRVSGITETERVPLHFFDTKVTFNCP
jgi:hypothetical protein